MKAVTIVDHKLVWADVPDPVRKSGEILVEVKAAGVNRADLMQRDGNYPPPPGWPEWPGLECSGIVLEADEGCRFKAGDKICALLGGGGYAERVVIPEGMVMSMPEGLSFAEAASLPETFATSYLNLCLEAGMKAGDKVFIQAGASGLGISAIQLANPSDFDWDSIFEGAQWFHFTGITPALGPNVVEICKEACIAAKKHGVKISCDLNYRGKLWTRAEAKAAMTELAKYIDVCISNEEDAKDVFGIEAENTDITAGELNKEGYKSVARQLMENYGFEKVAITLRESKSAFDNDWSAMLYDGENYCFSKLYHLHIIDRIGGGDSFGGGLIYALLSGKSSQEAIEFAVAASALKHSIGGDYNHVSVAEVEKLAGGDGSGRVQR